MLGQCSPGRFEKRLHHLPAVSGNPTDPNGSRLLRRGSTRFNLEMAAIIVFAGLTNAGLRGDYFANDSLAGVPAFGVAFLPGIALGAVITVRLESGPYEARRASSGDTPLLCRLIRSLGDGVPKPARGVPSTSRA